MNAGTVVFDRYRLHEQVGAGGAGVVWRATDELLRQTVALKRVTVTGLDDAQTQLTRDRALREARLAAQLRGHPHVVAVYDVLVDDGDIWLVMEYLPARSLGEIMAAQGPLDCGEVARIGAHIADALAAAHDRGIEHRDVKPGNVLIGHDGTVKLTDFGISHLTGDPQLTQTGISGTPAYLAPEVAGKGESSPASDIFSLGSTLYAAVEGQPPFGTDDNLLRLLNVVRTGIIRPPTAAGPLEPLLLRLLQVSPTTRPATTTTTTRDLLTDLATRLTATTEHGHPQPPPLRRWWPPPRRTTLAAGALLTLTAAGAIGLSPLTGNTDERRPPSTTAPAEAHMGPSTQKLREADPCPLIDRDALSPFGRATSTIAPFLESCQASINGSTDVRVILHSREAVSGLGELSREVGNVTIYRGGSFTIGNAPACHYFLLSAGEPIVEILAVTYEEPFTINVCALAGVATTIAADKLAENGITYTPNRIEDYALARSDACALLDNTALAKVPGLNPDDREAGYANWSCNWGGEHSVDVRFYLYDSVVKHLGDHRIIAGKDAYLQRDDPKSCKALVVHRPALTADGVTDMFWVDVAASLPQDKLCDLATDLATTVAGKLPT